MLPAGTKVAVYERSGKLVKELGIDLETGELSEPVTGPDIVWLAIPGGRAATFAAPVTHLRPS